VDKFSPTHKQFETFRDYYRLFVLDESGEGYWALDGGTYQAGPTDSTDLKKILGTVLAQGGNPPSGGGPPQPNGPGIIAVRRRKPHGTLFTLDPNTSEPLKAELWVSFDYGRSSPGVWSNQPPGIWDGSGHWDKVASSHWEMEDDRIAIRIKSPSPEEFHTGEADTYATYEGEWAQGNWAISPMECFGGVLPLVTFLATPNPNPASPGEQATDVPVFRLTCTFECDTTLNTKAQNLSASPTQFVVTRRVNARQRYKRHIISKYSHLNPNAGTDKAQDILALDDQDETKAMAAAYVRAHHNATYAGSITVPRVTTAYRVGDHISGIVGRDLPFTSNIGTGSGASEIYPSVISVTFDNDQRQATIIALSDRRAEFPARTRGQTKYHFQKGASRREPRAFGNTE